MRLPPLLLTPPLLALADYLDVDTGCSDRGVPGMNRLCMDWGNKRGHFFFDGQGRRCIRKGDDRPYSCNALKGCVKSTWGEVGCSW
ncbi:hypothetical protein C8A05DRAFT_36893 [Staphylotrichum tortipilum]|uniref:Secreted protein n=1 Tax=Staphylotrichum tortipilum TaxID=2831512 RepID=A0AAN6RQB0_9PEZI|nr:hypothetical protein C8A05DRAFT_36893 [Staphylotrichum longicolle]